MSIIQVLYIKIQPPLSEQEEKQQKSMICSPLKPSQKQL